MPIFLAAALFGTAAVSVNGRIETQRAYETALTQAREYADKGIVVNAVEQYRTAISINPTLTAYLEAGQVYLDNGDLSRARKWYKNNLKKEFPKEPETYLFGINVYLANNNYRMAFDVYDDYQGRGLYSEAVESAIDAIRYKYDLVGSFEGVSAFSGSSKTAAVRHADLWGYVDSEMTRKLPYIYQEADYFSTYAAVKDADGNPYYIDTAGNVIINEAVILDADPEFERVVAFKCIQSNMLLAYNGEIWNYYDAGDMHKLFGGYKNAMPIANGVGAVSKDGKKWALISNKGEELTDFIYDEVLADAKSIICRNGAIIVRIDDQYMLVDKAGTQIGNKTYDGARAFNDNSYAAVKYGGEWRFIDAEGNEYLRNKYKEVKSFSNGLAAVKQNGKWGYINTAGKLVIPCEFLDAKPFNTNGVSFVKVDNNTWKMLKLYQYNHG